MTAKQLVEEFSRQDHLGVNIKTHSIGSLKKAIKDLSDPNVVAMQYGGKVYLVNKRVLATAK